MNLLVKNTFIYTVGRMLPQITGFVLLPIYTKFLSPAEYGIVESMLVLGMVLTIFFSMATERSMFRLYHDYNTHVEKRNFVGNISFLVLAFSTLILALVFLLRNKVTLIYSEISFNPYFLYAIINAYFMAFSFIPLTLFQVQEKAFNFLFLSAGSFFIGIILILYYVMVKEEGAEGLLKGKMIGNIIMTPVNFIIIIRYSQFKIKKSILTNIFSFSLPMVPTLLTAWIMNMSNRIFIEQYFTLHEVGIFSLAFKISSVASIIVGSLFTAYNPVFYRLANEKDHLANRIRLKEINESILIFIIIICFGIAFFVKEIVQLFLDVKYIESAQIVPIIVLSISISQIGGLYNLMIYQKKKSIVIMLISIVGALLSIGFNFLLVPKYNIYGAAIAALLTNLIISIIKYFFARKAYFISMPILQMLFAISIGIALIAIDSFIVYPSIVYSLSIKLILVIIGLVVFIKKYFKRLKQLIV